MMIELPTRIQECRLPLLEAKGVRLFLKREDEIHPIISGNKWRKLRYNLEAVKVQKSTGLVTFGGAYSNHIAAVAGAGKHFGFRTVGIIRGERIEPLNPTLQFATDCGMELKFASRTTYRTADRVVLAAELAPSGFFLIPEGGTNGWAIKGCAEIVEEARTQLPQALDYYATACGTGGTIAGLIAGTKGQEQVLGISVLKGDFMQSTVQGLLDQYVEGDFDNWSVKNKYHFGGYAKLPSELIEFIRDFKRTQGVLLDPIYTSKLIYGLLDLVEQDYFKRGISILALHTGGLQAWKGFEERLGIKID